MDIHSTEFQSEGLGGGYLSPEEINIIRGALDMTEKKAFVGMTPLDKVGDPQPPALLAQCVFLGQFSTTCFWPMTSREHMAAAS